MTRKYADFLNRMIEAAERGQSILAIATEMAQAVQQEPAGTGDDTFSLEPIVRTQPLPQIAQQIANKFKKSHRLNTGEDINVNGNGNNNDGGAPPGGNTGGAPGQGPNTGPGPRGAGGGTGGDRPNRPPRPNANDQDRTTRPLTRREALQGIVRALLEGDENAAREIAKTYAAQEGDETLFDILLNEAGPIAQRLDQQRRQERQETAQAQRGTAQPPNQAEAPQQMSQQERGRRQNEIVAALQRGETQTAQELASELSFDLMEQGADLGSTRVEDILRAARREAEMRAATEELEIQRRAEAVRDNPRQWLSAQFDLIATAYQTDSARARRMAEDLVRTLQTYADGQWRNLTVDEIITNVSARLQQEDVALEVELAALAAVADRPDKLAQEVDRVMAALQNSDTKYKKLSRKQLLEMLKKWMAKKKKAKGGKRPGGNGPDKRPPPGGAGSGAAGGAPAGTAAPKDSPNTKGGGAAAGTAGAGGVVLTLDHVKQAKWDTFCGIYKMPEELLGELKLIATLMVKKGRDSSAAVQEAKGFLMRAKKKGHGKVLKNGLHLCVAIEDLLIKRAEGKKLTKVVKFSASDSQEVA